MLQSVNRSVYQANTMLNEISSAAYHLITSLIQIMDVFFLVGKDIVLDAVCRQFEPYPYSLMCLHVSGALVV